MKTDSKMTHEGLIALRKAFDIARNVELISYHQMLQDYSYDNVSRHHRALKEKRRLGRELAKANREMAKCNLTTPA